jgi:site-specific DNA-cytosine methylase
MGFDEVYQDLSQMGYAVEAGIFTAEEAGAPQERKRLFILALKNDWLSHPDFKRLTQGDGFSDKSAKWASGSSKTIFELADTGLQRPPQYEESAAGIEQLREKPGDTHGIAAEPGKGEFPDASKCNEAAAPGQIGQWGGNGPVHPSKALAYTHCARLPKPWAHEQQVEAGDHGTLNASVTTKPVNGCGQENQGQYSSDLSDPDRPDGQGAGPWTEQTGVAQFGDFHGWPAGRGQPQHPWEEKRTVEPGLGCTINGYNFREDLLRAYGNSVVEQTAEIAFLTLLEKHRRNLEISNYKKIIN